MAAAKDYECQPDQPSTVTREPAVLRRSKTRLPVVVMRNVGSKPETMTTNTTTRSSSSSESPLDIPGQMPFYHAPCSSSNKNVGNSTNRPDPGGPASPVATASQPQKHWIGSRPPTAGLKTPSLVSGSSVLIANRPQPNLRCEGLTVDTRTPRMRAESSNGSKSSISRYCRDDLFPGAILGVSLPIVTDVSRHASMEKESRSALIQSLSSQPIEECQATPFQYTSLRHELSSPSSSTYSESLFSILSTSTPATSYSPAGPFSRHLAGGAVNSPNHDKVSCAEQEQVESNAKSEGLSAQDSESAVLLRSGAMEESRRLGLPTGIRDTVVPCYVQAPPELAHLNVDDVVSTTRHLPPSRLSRDGTSDLLDQLGDPSIVRSDRPALYAALSKHTDATKPAHLEGSPSDGHGRISSLPDRYSSRPRSPRVGSNMDSFPSSVVPYEEPGAGVQTSSGKTAVSTRPSRLDFLSKHSSERAADLKTSERGRKRGPAAGTGHEGYDRPGFRVRNGSLDRVLGAGRLSSVRSTESSVWTPAICGREVVNANVRGDELGRSLIRKRDTESSRNREDMMLLPNHSTRINPRAHFELKASSRSDAFDLNVSEDACLAPLVPSLHEGEKRRTSGALESQPFPDGAAPLSLAPRCGKWHCDQVCVQDGQKEEEGRLNPASVKERSQNRPDVPSSFAMRLLADTNTASPGSESNTDRPEALSWLPESQRAHYTLKPHSSSVSLWDIKRLADLRARSREIKDKGLSAEKAVSATCVPQKVRHEQLLPSPHLHPSLGVSYSASQDWTMQPDLAVSDVARSSQLRKAEAVNPANPPEPSEVPASHAGVRSSNEVTSRLHSVGRIPHVISKKDRKHEHYDWPFLRSHANKHPSPVSDEVNGSHTRADAVYVERFFEFPSRRNSFLSYTSSSDKSSVETVTAEHESAVDDTWSEYNALCEELMPSTSAGPSSDVVESRCEPSDSGSPKLPKAASHVRRSNYDRAKLLDESQESVIPRLYQTSQSESTPSTPFSISDYLGDNDERSKPSTVSGPHPKEKSNVVSELALTARIRTGEEESHLPNTLSEKPSESAGPATYREDRISRTFLSGEFRHAAIVTSKWLSFGRVLFSPVHEDAKAGGDARILILDGLGKGESRYYCEFDFRTNSSLEWSYYCALNYPACQFYHLGSEPTVLSKEALSNYRHVTHSSMSTPFPFPRGFFSGVVLRFPQVTSAVNYQACISEVNRTLRPGGHLEMSTLDLDLVNMGSKARRAVKELKMRIHGKDSQLSLWNQGDMFLKLLGRRNFEKIRRCVVALPAAGRVTRSQDSTKFQKRQSSCEGEPQVCKETGNGPGLVDLLRNSSEDGQLDEEITKTVARVGRWWYSACYEEAFGGTNELPEPSLWTTPGLMPEMEREGTSLKLLICSAQKPMCAKRRTASV